MNITARALLARWRVGFLLGILVIAGIVKGYELTHNRNYQPVQPVLYSHKLHAGKLGMDCLYCHTNAQKSRHATIPAVETCMGCHSVVRTDRPEIQKLTEYYNSGEPVPWVRVHSLPDHVFFNHSAHVDAGVACQACHGPIQEMEEVYQYVDLSMGWCISCHRSDQYLRTPERLAKQTAHNRFAHSYYRYENEPRRYGEDELQAKYDDYSSLKRDFWDTQDLDIVENEQGMTPEALHRLIEGTLGYDSYARQEGDRGTNVINHTEAFQNASIDCNTCHQ